MFSEDAIQQVSGFTDTTREQAVLLLKKYGEAEKAVNAFFDDPEKALQEEKRGWDEPPPYHEAEVPYGPQNLEGSMFAGAPSRPPSRINSQRSLVDLTHNDAPSGEVQSLTKEQQEEQDFQQALSNSMNDVPSGQQSGITGVGQRFGPANREFYDKESWAMVPTSAAREVVHSQQPADRQRKPDEPAFLRSSPYGDRLPSLLTILHSIPLAREVLLVKELSAPRYGFDNQWWNGHTINVPKVVAYGENRDWEDIIFEVQRLMAFLDSTQRAYGSTEALSSLDHYRSKRSDTDLSKFFECWDASAKIVEHRSTNCTVFSSTALKHDENGPDLGLKRDFYCLEPPVQENETTIYDVLDRVIWSDGPESLDNGFADTFIGGLGEVFTAQFTPKNQNQIGCGITIPAVWYPDRYLKEFRKEALDMRRRAQQYRLDAEKVDKQIEQVLKHKLNNGKVVDAKEVLLKAAMAVETVGKAKIPNGLTQELVTIEGKELSAAETTKCVTEIKSALDMIDKKLHDLQARREQALAACKAVMSEFTEASPDASRKPTHSRRQIDLLVAEDALNDEWEWWRASFSKEDGKLQQQEKKAATEASDNNTTLKIDQPALSASQLHSKSDSDDLVGYTLKRVSEADVLKAATDESKSVLVVYASDAAVAYNGSPPNHQLQAFVHTDNEAFTAELSGDGDYEMISNKSSATLGNEDERADNDDSDMEPLISMKNGRDRSDSKPTSPLSPQSVSTSSFRRGGDDDEIQPSPKRSKGYNERMSLSPSGGDNLSTSPSIDRRVTDHIEGADVEKSGSHHVEKLCVLRHVVMTQSTNNGPDSTIETLGLLEARLRRLEWIVTGNASVTSEHTPPSDLDTAKIVTRIEDLERDLQKLANRNSLARQVLQLHSQYPSLFHPVPPSEIPSTLSDENLASIILSCASSFPETASRLESLKDNPIPPAGASEQLIKLQPRLDKASDKQKTQVTQVRELRERSAKLLKRWYEVGIVGQGEVWTAWADRVEKLEREVRRAEKAREVQYT